MVFLFPTRRRNNLQSVYKVIFIFAYEYLGLREYLKELKKSSGNVLPLDEKIFLEVYDISTGVSLKGYKTEV